MSKSDSVIFRITSRNNETVKEAAKLKQKKYRQNSGTVLLEGERLIFDALGSGVELKQVFLTKDNLNLADKFKNISVYEVTYQVMEVLSSTVTPSGIAAVAQIKKQEFAPPKGNFLVLDSVNDAGNLGTILRTACACGFMDVYCINCADVFNDKALRASMGAVFKVRSFETDVKQIAQMIKQRNLPLLAADMKGISIFKYKPPNSPFGLVVGNEANGISKEISAFCTDKVSLPMQNNVESLNAGVSASVIMYLLQSNDNGK